MTQNSSRSALSSALQSYLDSLVSDSFVAAESFAESIAEAVAAAEAEATALYIVFYYEITDIKDQVYMLSHYKAKNIKSNEKEPKSRLDELTITDDEEEMLARLLKNAAKDIYKIIYPYGKDISGGFVYDADVLEPVEYDEEADYDKGDLFYVSDQLYYTINDDTPAGTDPEDVDYFAPVGEWYNTYKKIVYSLNYNENFDPSMIAVLNDDIEDAIIKHCLLHWYKTIRELDMIPLSQEEYDDACIKVRRSLWAEIIPTRRRTEII